ncbi:hypothetical protein BDL97_17G072500 [Sphagnum fallax]|nr:hypothetical protein BDL97_17G072500 [Sphagnum fallax]KAH8936197.1 hypothetical protein BDL97_17G072500 [Sphagnum fallax]
MHRSRQEAPTGALRAFNLGPFSARQAPQHGFHIIGRFLRLLSVYAAYRYLVTEGISVVVFMFVCLLGSAGLFLILQRPWRGRPLSSSLLVPTLINGGVMALSLVLWGRGLRTCGPVRTILAEYAGAVLGAISTLLFGRSGFIWRRVAGLVAILAAFYFLSQGWALSSNSPFSSGKSQRGEEEVRHIGLWSMLLPALSGVLAALRRIISRRVSLKSLSKKRLHAVTVTSAACCLFPFALVHLALTKGQAHPEHHASPAWAYSSTILFGIVLIFYVDSFVEDRLHVVVASPQHLLVTAAGIIILELLYGMDFSLLGFTLCTSVLGLGIYEATSTDRGKGKAGESSHSDFLNEDQDHLTMSTLPS